MGLFFFSSRRRHTRCSRDWSSDVCSSDLVLERVADRLRERVGEARDRRAFLRHHDEEIGRASCRERVYISVVPDAFYKKTYRNYSALSTLYSSAFGRRPNFVPADCSTDCL